MVVTLGDVLFDTGRATLQPGAQRSVEQLVQVLTRHAERRVLIEGFTDSVGGEEMNLQLSRRRAETFQQQLLNGGIAADRIELRAWGEANPVADNGSAAGRQQNRRVEVLFSDASGRFAAR
jgi:outer membrane protein OmpA-like peptidoglycan-associated protein